jgi:hypothetical protein
MVLSYSNVALTRLLFCQGILAVLLNSCVKVYSLVGSTPLACMSVRTADGNALPIRDAAIVPFGKGDTSSCTTSDSNALIVLLVKSGELFSEVVPTLCAERSFSEVDISVADCLALPLDVAKAQKVHTGNSSSKPNKKQNLSKKWSSVSSDKKSQNSTGGVSVFYSSSLQHLLVSYEDGFTTALKFSPCGTAFDSGFPIIAASPPQQWNSSTLPFSMVTPIGRWVDVGVEFQPQPLPLGSTQQPLNESSSASRQRSVDACMDVECSDTEADRVFGLSSHGQEDFDTQDVRDEDGARPEHSDRGSLLLGVPRSGYATHLIALRIRNSAIHIQVFLTLPS